MVYCFDIDGTICHTEGRKYEESVPFPDMVERINRLYADGHTIKLYTARGMSRFNGDTEAVYAAYHHPTYVQMQEWGINYHELILAKPSYDVFVDDKNMPIEEFKRNHPLKKGFLAGAFDILHPGYIAMLREAKANCDHLTVALHADPSIERPEKAKPVFSPSELEATLLSVSYVDKVIHYKTEDDLLFLLKNEPIDIRFLGDDYRGKEHLGFHLKTPIYYIERDHGWSHRKVVQCLKSSSQEVMGS